MERSSRRGTTIIGVATALMIMAPAAASGAGRTDPHADSPAGAIYQIPIDSGRRDGAPATGSRTGGGGSGTTGAGGAGAAANGSTGSGGGSGTSGADGSGAAGSGASGGSGGDGASGGGAAPGGGTAADPSSIHSENGFGSSSHVPGVSDPGVPTLAGSATRAGGDAGSGGATYALLSVAALVALGCGVAAAGRLGH